MRVVTWNIYKDNKNIKKAVNFLKSLDADVICLQEFPLDKVDLLNDLGMSYVLGEEFLSYKNRRKPDQRLYMVIASKMPIQQHVTIKHKNLYEDVTYQDDRYQDFKADSLFVDIPIGKNKLRIFNVHFKCVAGPYHRLSQFREVMENLSEEYTNIICGDFNTFGKPITNIFYGNILGTV